MKVTITSKNNEKIFGESVSVINIGTASNCHYKLNLPFELVISVQKLDNGKWRIINTSKSNKVLFRGQPIGAGIEIASLCKLMIDGTDEFIGIKITQGGTNVKVVPGSLELANRKSAEKIKKIENKKTIASIGDEEINEQDIEILYGKGIGAQTKIKIDKRKEDIERRRALISKEISYKSNDLRAKISQNELILGILNIFILIIPLTMAYILKDVIRLDSLNGQLQTRVLFLVSVAFVITTALLKQAQFLMLQTNGKRNVNPSTVRIKSMCALVSYGTFFVMIAFAVSEIMFHSYQLPVIIPQMILLCAFLCIFLGIFSGFTKNIIAESGEELDSYESREDFQAVVKDYQQWVNLFVNNITKKKLKELSNKIFNLQIMCAAEYILGVITSPFLAYGVSQTLAEALSDPGITLAGGFRFSPIFLALSTFMIIFAFHCFAVAFSITKRVFASNVIKQDGFSDYNVHGVMIHGVESTKNLKKESKKFFFIAVAVVFVEITMNMSYFLSELGDDVIGMVKAIFAALIPTALLIMETNMVANTKFEIKIREELMEKVDKDY